MANQPNRTSKAQRLGVTTKVVVAKDPLDADAWAERFVETLLELDEARARSAGAAQERPLDNTTGP